LNKVQVRSGMCKRDVLDFVRLKKSDFVHPWFCMGFAMQKHDIRKELVGSWLTCRTWVRRNSPAVCQTLNGGAVVL
jgi:hypothetical protein